MNQQPKRAIFTICSGNYFPYARILLTSLQLHHPEADLFLCLADRADSEIELGIAKVEVIVADTLNIYNFADFAFRYDIMEFNTAVKPFMMQWLIEDRGYTEVVYLDPDIELFAPITPVFASLESGANFAITPHITAPAEFGEFPDDIGIMKSGIYNLGFIAIKNSQESISFLHWWGRRLRYQCVNQQDEGIFVDQKYIDLLPAFSDKVAILRNPELNIAYWNLDQRKLTQTETGWLVDEQPLRFFHFSGINVGQPERLSKHTTRFNGNLQPALQAIVQQYIDKLIKFGYGVEPYKGYSYSRFANGIAISDIMRRCYRDLDQPWLEDPFNSFDHYLNRPSKAIPESAPANHPWLITNLMYYIWSQRQDLQREFNLNQESDRLRFCYWYIESVPVEYDIDYYFILPIVEKITQNYSNQLQPRSLAKDICVVGYLNAEISVGQSGRMVAMGLQELGVKLSGYNVLLNVIARQAPSPIDDVMVQKIKAPIQVYNVNADQLGLVRQDLRHKTRQDSYKISMPFWELSKFPQEWVANLHGINEIWAGSRFVQASLQLALSVPVFFLPTAVVLSPFTPRPRSYFKLPDQTFLFHFNFDLSSYAPRKNPQAAIAAYRLAFRNYNPGVPTALVIKTRGVDHQGNNRNLEQLQEAIADEPDIYLINQQLSHPEAFALMDCCDCYISLHRSEGFGLTLAEAMLLEKPVISTDYSGTTDFVNQQTGFPVNYKMIPVGENEYPFWQNQHWAEADINHAAWLMRKIISDETTTSKIAHAGKQKILQDYSFATISKLYEERLNKIIATS